MVIMEIDWHNGKIKFRYGTLNASEETGGESVYFALALMLTPDCVCFALTLNPALCVFHPHPHPHTVILTLGYPEYGYYGHNDHDVHYVRYVY